MKNSFLILLLCLVTIGLSAQNSMEVAKCDIQIDKSNTKFYKLKNGNYAFKSIVRHTPPFGNDDDAHKVKITIDYNDSFRYVSLRASQNDIPLDAPQIDNQGSSLSIIAKHIPRAEHVEIHLELEPLKEIECYQISIAAMPGRPIDPLPSDNFHSIYKRCPVYIVLVPQWELKVPSFKNFIPLPDICKYVIDCPGCNGNFLCNGDVLRIPEIPAMQGVNLLYDRTPVAKGKYDKKARAYDIRIPKTISKKSAKRYSLQFTKK